MRISDWSSDVCSSDLESEQRTLASGPKCNKYLLMSRPRASGERRLDSFDRAILRILQRDNKTPPREIAGAVNLSAAAVQRRIAAMEAAGIIDRNVALLVKKALDMTTTAIVAMHQIDARHPPPKDR